MDGLASRWLLLALGWLCLLSAKVLAFSNSDAASSIEIPLVSHAPQVEDFLNNNPREAEAVAANFRQQVPGDGVPASHPTTVYLSYDQENLYVVFMAKDNPAEIRAHKTKRDDILSDDYVCANIDTFLDGRRNYFFCSNPYGIQMDGISPGPEDDLSFDMLWYSEGRLLPDGFLVLQVIPFRSLRFPRADAQEWGISLGRSISRSNEVSFWPYITQRVSTFQTQFGSLRGIKGVSPGHNIQFIPYGMITAARFLDVPPILAPGIVSRLEGRVGLDVKAVIKGSFTLDAAVNPDFSQVESDEPRVTVNRRYEVYFPEKRPLFTENAGFFRTPEQLFFSRRIVDPQWGARLTGKYGPWAIGILAADDRAPGRAVADSDPAHDRRTTDSVVRVAREFGSNSHIGLLATSYNFADSSNHVIALDARFQLAPNWYVEGQTVGSTSASADGQPLAGTANVANLTFDNRHSSYHATYTDRTPDFRAELGFIPRTDIRQMQHFVGYSWRPEGKRVVSFGPHLSALMTWDHAAQLQDWEIAPEFVMELTRITTLSVKHSESYERFQNIGFRKNTTAGYFSSQWTKWLAADSSFSTGKGVNYQPASTLLPFLGNTSEASFGLGLRPTAQLQWNQTYLYSRLATIREASLPIPDSPSVAFNNHVLRSKLNYQVSRELSLRIIVDYNGTLPNQSLVSLEKTKQLGVDLLFTYLLHPGTAFYAGYTDNYENVLLRNSVPPMLARSSAPTTSVGRQFFIKMSYLFRL